MSKESTTGYLSSVLKYPFQDEKWLGKLAVGSVLMLVSMIPILGIVTGVLLVGYLAEIIRRVAVSREDPSLPDWDDLSKYFQDGFKLFGVGFVYSLPSLVLLIGGYLAMLIPVFSMEMIGEPSTEGVGLILGGYFAGFALMGIGMLVSLATGVIMPAAGCHVVAEDSFGAGFRIGEWWRILKANWSGFLVSFVVLVGGGMLLYYLSYFLVITVILCCLYPIVLAVEGVYLALIAAALFSQAYREGVQALDEKITSS